MAFVNPLATGDVPIVSSNPLVEADGRVSSALHLLSSAANEELKVTKSENRHHKKRGAGAGGASLPPPSTGPKPAEPTTGPPSTGPKPPEPKGPPPSGSG